MIEQADIYSIIKFLPDKALKLSDKLTVFIHCSYAQRAVTTLLEDSTPMSWLSAVGPHFFLENAHNALASQKTYRFTPLIKQSDVFLLNKRL